MSIRRKTFTFAEKQHPQVPKHFGKVFAVQAKTAKALALLYYTVSIDARVIDIKITPLFL